MQAWFYEFVAKCVNSFTYGREPYTVNKYFKMGGRDTPNGNIAKAKGVEVSGKILGDEACNDVTLCVVNYLLFTCVYYYK